MERTGQDRFRVSGSEFQFRGECLRVCARLGRLRKVLSLLEARTSQQIILTVYP